MPPYKTPLPLPTHRAGILKHITAVNYSFCNKLECLSLNLRLGWKGLLGTNTLAYYENRKIMSIISFITYKRRNTTYTARSRSRSRSLFLDSLSLFLGPYQILGLYYYYSKGPIEKLSRTSPESGSPTPSTTNTQGLYLKTYYGRKLRFL
jgi:hypothetical protein